ncbi:hypothetical protein [Thalassobaculum sp.]
MNALRIALIAVFALSVSGCHMAHHVPPGQMKHVVSPPPGQAKKPHWH